MARYKKPLARAVCEAWRGRGFSINSDLWPGVVAVGEGWRVILARDASRYRLQRKSRAKPERWEPVYGLPSDPASLARVLAQDQPAFAGKIADLPADPHDALPAIAQAVGASVSQAQRRSYWSAPDYPGVIATDANVRSVRDRSGTVYAVQWRSGRDYIAGKSGRWITQAAGPSWPELVEQVSAKTYVPGTGSKDGTFDRMATLFQGCPEVAADGPWPVVKVRPAPSSRPLTKK